MRLIDADALGVGRCSRDLLPADYCAGWNGLVGLIEQAPTIDAVEVVRCKDCVHRFEAFKPEIENGGGICMKMYDTGKIEGHLCRVKADDFCSYGELRSHHDSLCDQTEEVEP